MGHIGRFPSGGSGTVKLNQAEQVEVVAQDRIKVGDTIYTIQGTEGILHPVYYSKLQGILYCAAFSPDGGTLVLGGNFTGYGKVYAVGGTSIRYVSDLPDDAKGAALSNYISTAVFSPDGKYLVVGGIFTGRAKLYTVDGTTVAYAGDFRANAAGGALSDRVAAVAFSPGSGCVVLGGYFSGYAKVYGVDGSGASYLGELHSDGDAALDAAVSTAAFSPDGGLLVLGGNFAGYGRIYTASGTEFAYVGDIQSGGGALDGAVRAAAFLPSGEGLILGGSFTGYARVYTVNGTTVAEGAVLPGGPEEELNRQVMTITVAPDGGSLVLGGNFTGYAKLYTVAGTAISYRKDLPAAAEGRGLDNYTNGAAFSPDSGRVVVVGSFSGYAKAYAVDGSAVSYEGDLYANDGITAIDGNCYAAAFSPDGNMLALGGAFSGRAKLYAVRGNAIAYLEDLCADAEGSALNSYVRMAVFSPDSRTLILAGEFSGFAKVYSVDGRSASYVGDLCGDAEGTPLSSYAKAAAFSPDGSRLALAGTFNGRAKLYAVRGNAITYLEDLCADAVGTALSAYAATAAFSPDGKTLVLGGNFAGRAKVYAMDGGAASYVGDLYAKAGTTALSNYVNTAVFSPDGGLLVLGGNFSGRGKVYAVNGTSIAYVADLRAGTTALSGYVNTAAFSPDGTGLVLGGNFSGRAKLFTVSGTTVTHVGNISADKAGTALSGYASAAAFSPSGGMLVLTGIFEGFGLRFLWEKGGPVYETRAWPVPLGALDHGLAHAGIGFASGGMEPGETGTVTLIGGIV